MKKKKKNLFGTYSGELRESSRDFVEMWRSFAVCFTSGTGLELFFWDVYSDHVAGPQVIYHITTFVIWHPCK